MARRGPILLAPSLALALASLAGSALANDVSTSFEFTDTSGQFRLGAAPTSVLFFYGEAKSVGNPELHHSGTHAFLVAPGRTAILVFETPAIEVELFVRTESLGVQGVLTLRDAEDNVLQSVQGSPNAWTHVTHSGTPAVASIRVQNAPSSSGYVSVDDFSACSEDLGPPLADPLPAPIQTAGPAVRLRTLTTNLTAPNWGTHAPGHPRTLFVTDQTGQILALDVGDGGRRVFHDVSARLVPLGAFGPGTFDERGLLGLAFHPDFATNGLLYTYTSEPATAAPDFSTMPLATAPNHQSVLLEWTVQNPLDPDAVVDPSSARELLRIDQPQFNHNGGCLAFGPDGMLYVSLGDGGGADDVDGQPTGGGLMVGHGFDGNGQDKNTILGTVLRIDPLGTNGVNGRYGVPADNPFVGADGLDEVFAYGLRNPFRFSFDMLTGAMYIADVGQNDVEEINIGFPGANYGWNHKEGGFFFVPNGFLDGYVTDVDPGVPAGLVDPVAQYDHDEGLAVIGGFVYRGGRLPFLQGTYVFGELAKPASGGGRLLALRGSEVIEIPLHGQGTVGMFVLGLGQDAFGEVYLLGNSTQVPFGQTGVVMRLEPLP